LSRHPHGETNLKDGLPFCPPHHHMADHPKLWDMRRLPGGGIRFSRRQQERDRSQVPGRIGT